jgi:hypothetical protein
VALLFLFHRYGSGSHGGKEENLGKISFYVAFGHLQ